MPSPPIQYAHTPDGASIAYWVMRNGPSAVVHVPYPWSHLSNEWKLPEIVSWYERLGTDRTLINYDLRQSGMSSMRVNSWPASDEGLDAMYAGDLEAVVDAAGVERVAILGSWLPGVHSALAFATRYPQRVSHLVLWGTSTRGTDLLTDSTTASTEIGLVDRDQLVRVILHSFQGWPASDSADRLADVLLSTAGQGIVGSARAGLNEQSKAVNLDDMAVRLQVPTLVLHPRGSQMVTEEVASRLASTIPNAQLVLLDGDSLDLRFGVADQALEAINAFLAEPSPASPPIPASEEDLATAPPVGPPYPDHLSEREVQVLRLVAIGLRNAEIADQLIISINTVARHISHIFNKTGVTNRTEATRYAIRNGLSE